MTTVTAVVSNPIGTKSWKRKEKVQEEEEGTATATTAATVITTTSDCNHELSIGTIFQIRRA